MTVNTIGRSMLAVTAAFLLSGYDACDPLIPNNGFDLWCGETLCSWELEQGEIRQVPTWHEADHGVELVGNAVALSQFSDVTSDQVDCIRFDLVADVAETANVTLEMDFFDDGVVELERQIPTSSWEPISYLVTLPTRYQGIRFRLRKRGSGRAVLAQIVAESADKCVEPALEIAERPRGARCEGAGECASGICGPDVTGWSGQGVCAGCVDDGDCAADEVCGSAVDPEHTYLDFHRACTPPGTRVLGERCAVDGECATGVCCESVCSTCCGDGDCATGACERREATDALEWWWAPLQCGPGTGGAASGEPCLIDGDCASATCTGAGALRVCALEGRTCTDDTDCQGEAACLAVGTAGGTCA